MSTAAPPVLPERLYTAILRCRDCGAELNRAEHVQEHDRTVSARSVVRCRPLGQMQPSSGCQ
jgi:hypothetical protein